MVNFPSTGTCFLKNCAACLLLVILASSADIFAQDSSWHSQIIVQDNKFVEKEGKTMTFRGLNSSDPDKLDKDGHWNREYFQEMKRWGANIVRFPVHPTAWRARGREEYLKLLDTGVALAKEAELYVIIDWHSIGNLKSDLYQDPMYVTSFHETLDFWKTMAEHFKGNTTVAFFELYNEPTTYNNTLGFCSWTEWKQMMEQVIDTIRSNGCKTIPLVAGFNWAYDLTEVATSPIQRNGIGYVSHPYPMKREKPWEEKWTNDWGFVAEKYPVILTEIGFCGPDDDGAHIPVISDESYGEAITKYSAEKGISYVAWVFDPQWSPMLIKDWNFTPTRQGKFFKGALQKQSSK